jgi:rubrerythrin
MGKPEEMWQCQTVNCGYIYDPDRGDRKGKVPKGTRFEDLPEAWKCPVCGAGKRMFRPIMGPGSVAMQENRNEERFQARPYGMEAEKEAPEMKLNESRTGRNLLTAFAGESQARNRYTYFAGQARKEGYEQISFIFEETANQEKEHAKRFFKFLEGGEMEVRSTFPAGVIGNTRENLLAAAAGENHEHSELYPGFAKVAREEGFPEIAGVFEAISVAEKQHEKRYLALAANVGSGKVFKRDREVVWRCRNCGYLHTGQESPETCPACAHPQAHFELLGENW